MRVPTAIKLGGETRRVDWEAALKDVLIRLAAALLFLSAADAAMGRNRTIHAPAVASALSEKLDIGDVYYDCGRGRSSRCRISEFMKYAKVCALLVVKSGAVRFQAFNRDKHICKDEGSEPDGRTKKYGVASVAKSITSTLLGQIITTRYRARTRADFDRILTQSIGDFIPELVEGIPSAYVNVPLDHVLRMRSGVRWSEYGWHGLFSGADFFALMVRKSMAQSILAFAHRYPFRRYGTPTAFNYSALDAAVVAATAERLLEDSSLVSFMETEFWAAIGAEADATWGVDKAGTAIGPCCLRATVGDLARFGLLVLNEGRAPGQRQIIARSWFEIATKRTGDGDKIPDDSQSQNLGCRLEYRYFWWLRDKRNDFTAIGRNGQFVHIYPDRDTVIVQISDWDTWSDPLLCETFLAHDALEAAAR